MIIKTGAVLFTLLAVAGFLVAIDPNNDTGFVMGIILTCIFLYIAHGLWTWPKPRIVQSPTQPSDRRG